jgi:hypothetical protein
VPTGRETRRAVAAALAALAATALLSGCGEPAGRPPAAPSPTGTTGPTPSGTVAPVSVAPSESPTVDEESVPAETAGALGSDDVPAPPDLGRGWRQYVDPGDPEDGYTGNGSWVRARGGAEVVQALLPLGCTGLRDLPRLPVPRHALEATYRGPGGAPAVALVLSYASVSEARDLLLAMGAVGRDCPAPETRVGRSDPLVAVVTQERADAAVVLDRRREYGAGASGWVWSEAVVRRGARVGLLTVASTPGADRPDLRGLAAAVRRSLG